MEWGIQFITPLRAEFLVEPGEDRRIMLLEPMQVLDRRMTKLFTIPAGFICDGASIPRLMWTVVGSPLTGDYRRAAVLHDYECRMRKMVTLSSGTTHERFYRAMRDGGVGYNRARIMRLATDNFGPQW